MQTKNKKTDRKRHGIHHSHNKHYKNVYWPYLPMLALALVFSFFAFFPTSNGRVLKYATEMSRENLLLATNSQRVMNGQKKLDLNDQLNLAAQAKAEDMARRNYWSHKTPEGYDPWVFIDQAGYDYHKAGENLAYGFDNSTTTVLGWMNSASHRANLLDVDFTEVGFGFSNTKSFQSTSEETIVVAMYGRPLASSPPVQTDVLPVEAVESKPVTKAETLTKGRISYAPFAVGLLGGGAVTGLLVNHSLRLRRFLRKSERYFVAHPLLDVSLILIAFACYQLSKAVGYIL